MMSAMPWAADNTKLPNNYFSSLVNLKSLEKRLAKDEDLREKYTKTIKEDLNMGYVIEVPNAHKVENWSDKEWYLPHQPVLNPNKLGKVRRVLNGAANFMVPRWISPCSLTLIWFKTLFTYFFASDNTHMPSLPTSRECFYRLAYYHQINNHFDFCGGRTPQLTLQCINLRAIFSGIKTRLYAPTMHYNALLETTHILPWSCKSRSRKILLRRLPWLGGVSWWSHQ